MLLFKLFDWEIDGWDCWFVDGFNEVIVDVTWFALFVLVIEGFCWATYITDFWIGSLLFDKGFGWETDVCWLLLLFDDVLGWLTDVESILLTLDEELIVTYETGVVLELLMLDEITGWVANDYKVC